MRLAGIVEGHGEVRSFRVLVERVCNALQCEVPDVLPPLRVRRNQVVKADELERHVDLLANRVGKGGAILVLLDADEDCAATLGPTLLSRARAARPDRRIAVVFAVREYEAWILASIETVRGERGIPPDAEAPPNPESVASPKTRVEALLPNGYGETVDQPALTARIDVGAARSRAPSFDKLVREIVRLLAPPPDGAGLI